MKSGQIRYKNESRLYKNSLKALLLEAEEGEADPDIFDMENFASETARFIKHYDTLLDIEGMLFNKAKEMLLQRFGSKGREIVSDFEEHMARVHDIDLIGKGKENIVNPLAIGASGESGLDGVGGGGGSINL